MIIAVDKRKNQTEMIKNEKNKQSKMKQIGALVLDLGKRSINAVSKVCNCSWRYVKKCSVDFEKNNLCKLKKYVSFVELGFETLEGKMHIECSDEKKKKYKIKKGNKVIAKVNELPPKFIDGLAEHYIMEYENIEDEKIITLMVVALNILMSN